MPYAAQVSNEFELGLWKEIGQANVYSDTVIPGYDGGHALRLWEIPTGGVVNCTVHKSKYAASVRGLKNRAFIQNFQALEHLSSSSIFGAGIIRGGTNTGNSPSPGTLYVSNAHIDMKCLPDPTYKTRNVDAVTIESENGPTLIRNSVLMGGSDAGIDAKANFFLDHSVVFGGHRALRLWHNPNGVTPDERIAIISNSLIVLLPGMASAFYGTAGNVEYKYYNCRFTQLGSGRVVSDVPREWVEEDGGRVTVTKMLLDPFIRDSSFFSQPRIWLPDGYPELTNALPTSQPPTPPPAPPPPPSVDPYSQLGRDFAALVKRAQEI